MRAWALGLMAVVGLGTACSDDDDIATGPQKPDVTFMDQIEYDGTQTVAIKSAIYEVDAQKHYTFYLSPSEGIKTVSEMKAAADYLAVTVENPKGTLNTETDFFEITYKDISIKKNTLKDVASIRLSADLVTDTRLNLYLNLEMKSGKTLFARYENTCVEGDLELNNQMSFDRVKSDIKSAVYTINEDKYSFFFSPSEGITTLSGMNKAADFVKITIDQPTGAIDTENGFYEIIYKELINVGSTHKKEVRLLNLSVSLEEENTKTSLDLVTKSGQHLVLAYNGQVHKDRVQLKNQYEFNRTITEIGSVLEWMNPSTGFTHFYLYNKKGITAPAQNEQGVEIKIANDLKGEIDFSNTDLSKVEVRCGEFVTGEGTTGKVSVTYVTDKFGNKEGLKVKLEAEKGENLVRAEYEGQFITGFASSNLFKVVDGDKTSENPIEKGFRQEPFNTGHIIVLGDAKNVTAPEALMQGNYAMKLTVAPSSFGKVIDAEKQTNEFDFELYDYKNFNTHYVSGGIKGTIQTIAHPGNEKLVYIKTDLIIGGTIKVNAEYYGELSGVKELPDLKPEKPFSSSLVIMDAKNEQQLMNMDIAQLQIRMESKKNWYGMDTYPTYYLYFVKANGDVDADYDTPMLALPVSLVDGKAEVDLAHSTDSKLHWNFAFSNSNLSRQSYGDTYTSYGMLMPQCPDEVKVKAVRNADKTWEITFTLTDFGAFNQWNPDQKSGTNNHLTITWKGAATKYQGYKKNDLTDDFF